MKPPKKNGTMRDVARLADVSVATVSAVIKGTPRVSAERERRVLDAMEVLDYHPDQIARSLRTGRTNVIGMVIPDITNGFYAEIVCGVEEAARGHDYSVILCNSNEDRDQEKRQIRALLSRRVDGILIAPTAGGGYDSLVDRRAPVVFFDRRPAGMKATGVVTDNFEAARAATRHLIELGHQQIAAVVGNLQLSPHAERLEGFRKAMQEKGLPVRDEYLRTGPHAIEGGCKVGTELLSLPSPPTAVFSSNNKMLLGLFRAISELGLRCPKDVSVVGFDDYSWTQYHTPRITTVAQPSHEIGRICVERLFRKIDQWKDKGSPKGIDSDDLCVLHSELRVRESTAPPKAFFSQSTQYSPGKAGITATG